MKRLNGVGAWAFVDERTRGRGGRGGRREAASHLSVHFPCNFLCEVEVEIFQGLRRRDCHVWGASSIGCGRHRTGGWVDVILDVVNYGRLVHMGHVDEGR